MPARDYWPLGKPLNVVVWNPMTMKGDRMQDISQKMENFDIVILSGTGVQSLPLDPTDEYCNYDSFRLDRHVFYSFGRSPRSNHSTGTGVLLSHRLHECIKIIDSAAGAGPAAGRVSVLRFGGGLLDFSIGPYYCPPKGSMPAARHQKVVDAIASFLTKQFDENAPARSTPLVGGDQNDDLIFSQENSPTIGVHNFGTSMKYASTTLVEYAKKMQLSAVNSHFASGATWFDKDTSSRISFLWAPTGLLPTISRCHVLKCLGRRLQHANVQYRYDHYPLLVSFPLDSPVPQEKPFCWDYDKISKMVSGDFSLRQSFISEVERVVEAPEFSSKWDEMITENPFAEDKWSMLNETLVGTAKQMFNRQHSIDKLSDEYLWQQKVIELRKRQTQLREMIIYEPTLPRRAAVTDGSTISTMHTETVSIEAQLEQLQVELTMTKNRIRKANTKKRRAKKRQLLAEIAAAEREREYAIVHSLTQRLNKRRLGKKGRIYGRFEGRRLSSEQWKEFLKKPAHHGGVSAKIINFEESAKEVYNNVLKDFQDGERTVRDDDMNLRMDANCFIKEMNKTLRKSKTEEGGSNVVHAR